MYFLVAGVGLAFLVWGLYKEWIISILLGGIILVVTGIVASESSDWNKEQRAKHRAEQIEDAKPRPYSTSGDGCTVYTFKTDRWQFFTRCDSTTTTDNSYKKSCGKNCNRMVEESITTENKQ
jgi:hypothetical protein